MTADEIIEFKAEISKNASDIVTTLMQTELGPTDSAFCLGSALKLISGVMCKLQGITQDEAEERVLDAFKAAFIATETQVIIAGGSDSTH